MNVTRLMTDMFAEFLSPNWHMYVLINILDIATLKGKNEQCVVPSWVKSHKIQ